MYSNLLLEPFFFIVIERIFEYNITILFPFDFFHKKMFFICDTPNPGVPLTTRQPVEFQWISGDPMPHYCVPFIGIHIFTKKLGKVSFVQGALPNIQPV